MHLYIVTAYHDEPKDIYSGLLSRINSQQGIDFSQITLITARSDGEPRFPDVAEYENLKGHTVFISNNCQLPGPGWSRQLGLEWALRDSQSDDDFIIFADCDDDFDNDTTLAFIIGCLTANPDADDMTFRTDQYDKINNEHHRTFYVPWQIYSTVYKLSFLKKYGIRFPKTCFNLEDAYLTVCRLSIPNARHYMMDEPFYIYTMSSPTSTTMNVTKKLPPKEFVRQALDFLKEYEAWEPGCVKLKAACYDIIVSCIYLYLEQMNFNLDDQDMRTELAEAIKDYSDYQEQTQKSLRIATTESEYIKVRKEFVKEIQEKILGE